MGEEGTLHFGVLARAHCISLAPRGSGPGNWLARPRQDQETRELTLRSHVSALGLSDSDPDTGCPALWDSVTPAESLLMQLSDV